eukprot:363631-Chlamydomonas_euryale.AAC.3
MHAWQPSRERVRATSPLSRQRRHSARIARTARRDASAAGVGPTPNDVGVSELDGIVMPRSALPCVVAHIFCVATPE